MEPHPTKPGLREQPIPPSTEIPFVPQLPSGERNTESGIVRPCAMTSSCRPLVHAEASEPAAGSGRPAEKSHQEGLAWLVLRTYA